MSLDQFLLDQLSVSELVNQTFQFYSHNKSFALPGKYDIDILDVTWVLSSTLIFFTMQTGIAMIEVGVCGSKNQVNVMMKNIVDMTVGGVAFWIFGFALMYGRSEYSNPFFGAGEFFVNAKSNDPLAGQVLAFLFFQLPFATTSTSLISGGVAERFRFTSYILFSFLCTFTYAVGGGWVWGNQGWLFRLGVFDFSGAGPIHIIGGAGAFVGAWFIGPRIGRYDKGTEMPQLSSPVYVCVGLMILWWGWIGFNTGCSYGIINGKWEAAARAGAGTTLASMAAGATSLLFSLAKHNGKVAVYEVVSGILSALVAINSGCYMFSMYSSFVTGSVAAILCLLSGPIVEKMRVDDAVGATAVHLVNGIWGQISVGLFADPPTGRKGLFIDGSSYQLIVQTISAFSLTIWAGVTTLIIIWIVNKIMPIRLTPEDEILGCDFTEHYLGENYGKELDQKCVTPLHSLSYKTPPVSHRYIGTIDEFGSTDVDSFYHRRKNFTKEGQVNIACDIKEKF